MAKRSRTTASAKRGFDPERAVAVRRGLLHLCAAGLLAAIIGVGVYADRIYVERKLQPPVEPPRVVLKNRPVWMSEFLAEQIARTAQPAGTHSSFDHQLLVDTVSLLKANPWIRDVKQVRRAYDKRPGDTLEVDCEYRAPVALVKWKDYFWLVDEQGVKLPEAFSPADVPKIVIGQDKRMNIRVIEGVAEAPPENGMKWAGEDLKAGIELVKLMFGRPFTEDIVKVDVSNFGGRMDHKSAQLVLVTRKNTEVRWGRPVTVGPDDFFVEIPPAKKLEFMEAIWREKGQVDGHFAWVDIRFDVPTHPAMGAAQTAGAELQR